MSKTYCWNHSQSSQYETKDVQQKHEAWHWCISYSETLRDRGVSGLWAGVTLTRRQFVQPTHHLTGSIPHTVIYKFPHFRKTKAKTSISYKPLSQNKHNFLLCFVKWMKMAQLLRTVRDAKWLISPNAIPMPHAQTPTCQTFVIATPVPLVTALTGGHF